MNHTDIPSSAIEVKTYGDLTNHCSSFVNGLYPFLMIIGTPGVAKSQSVRRTLGNRNHCYLQGHASPLGLFAALLQHVDLPAVLDDIDGLFADRTSVRLLKAICNSDPIKTVTWTSSRMPRNINGDPLPAEFTTKSSICLVANQWRTLDCNVAAIEDRAIVLHFCPSAVAVHEHVCEWFDDNEVYDFLAQHLPLITTPSMRFYIKGQQLRLGNPERWRELLLEMLGIEERDRFILKLVQDPSFFSEEARVCAFKEAGFGDRATFYRRKQRINFIQPTERHSNAILADK